MALRVMLSLVLVAASLAGCASRTWPGPRVWIPIRGQDETQVRHDMTHCQEPGVGRFLLVPFLAVPVLSLPATLVWSEVERQCFESRGYIRAQAFYTEELARLGDLNAAAAEPE